MITPQQADLEKERKIMEDIRQKEAVKNKVDDSIEAALNKVLVDYKHPFWISARKLVSIAYNNRHWTYVRSLSSDDYYNGILSEKYLRLLKGRFRTTFEKIIEKADASGWKITKSRWIILGYRIERKIT